MKIGVLREGKIPPDRRVPLTPRQCAEIMEKFPDAEVVVQTSPDRCFTDREYTDMGIEIREDLSNCDILLGVKEVPVENLIPGKIYMFFSHTIKKQAYNRGLLRAILSKKIQLVDYEVLTDKNGFRIIGFGRFAGLVGAYNGLRAWGLRNKTFTLKPARECDDLDDMLHQLDDIVLPPVKIAVTGDGRVAGGAVEVLDYMKVKRLTANEYLNADNPGWAVYVKVLPQHYVRRGDGEDFDLMHFFNHPGMYENAFYPFAVTTDLLISAAYWDPKAPVLFTAEEMKQDTFRITVISDITCDIEGSIPSTKRASAIDDPFYDYDPDTGEIVPPFTSKKNVTVQAVDNLPCELPKDASVDFGRNLIDKVFPSLFGDDPDEIIKRATITKDGKLTDRFSYLKDFAEGEE
jgi:saccharopine dehydrogenase (NAD+, L-lysine forming)